MNGIATEANLCKLLARIAGVPSIGGFRFENKLRV